MKAYCLCLALLLSVACLAATSPVSFELKAEKTTEAGYLLRITGTIAPGWHVYAQWEDEIGLEPVTVDWNQQNIIANGELSLVGVQPTDLQDPFFNKKKLRVYKDKFILTQPITIKGTIPDSLHLIIKCYAAGNGEFLDIAETKQVRLEGGLASSNPIKLAAINLQKPVADCGDKLAETGSSLWSIFIKGFAGGLIALLMPCIFPMLPVTVSFFMNRAKNRHEGIRNGLLYGAFIFLVYLLASFPFHIAGNINPQIFNLISTNIVVNLVFFLVFLLFALSLFGLFELKLPGVLANHAGRKSSVNSIAGIFFMALTLAIVSFSCTGPILGFLLVNSIDSANGAWALSAGMAGFGAALALPFGLFAMFPQWMKKLPKSGGWMETLKKSMAFVELALAFKFLSNADLVAQWGLLKRELFIALWFLVSLGLALYLYGSFNKNRQHKLQDIVSTGRRRISPRKIMAITVFLFALSLLPGLTPFHWGQPKWLSGFPPPLSYSIYEKDDTKEQGVEPDVVNDYDAALALARKNNKLLLVDFTGWACVNCRKMEEYVWTNKEVAELIKKHFVLVSLYVDDRGNLPEEKRFVYTGPQGQTRFIKTQGDKWAAFQAENFGSASQPQYVILSPDEELMNFPVGYSKAEEYKEWLNCGLAASRNMQR